MKRNRARQGFTLLEVLVATAIMGLAIAGLMNGLSTSVRSAARLADYDRAALLAQHKMDELLLAPKLPRFVTIEGKWEPAVAANMQGGWRARVTPFESGTGPLILERIELEVWWMSGDRQRTFTLEGFRKNAQ